jgi:hypothetical protein
VVSRLLVSRGPAYDLVVARVLAVVALGALGACQAREWYPLDADPRSALILEGGPAALRIRAVEGTPLELPVDGVARDILAYDVPLAELGLALSEGAVPQVDRGADDARPLPSPALWLHAPAGAVELGARDPAQVASTFDGVRVRAASCGTLRPVAVVTVPTARLPSLLVAAGDAVFIEVYDEDGADPWGRLVRVTATGWAPVEAVRTSTSARVVYFIPVPGERVGVLSGPRGLLRYRELDAAGQVVHEAVGTTSIAVSRGTAAVVAGERVVLLTDRDGALWQLERDSGALIPLLPAHQDTVCENEPHVQPLHLEDSGRLVYGRSGAPVSEGTLAGVSRTLRTLIAEEPRVACRATYARGPADLEAVWIEEPREGLDSPLSRVWWRTAMGAAWIPHDTPGGLNLQLAFVGSRLVVPRVEAVSLWAYTEGTRAPRLCAVRSLGGPTRKVVASTPSQVVATTGREGQDGNYKEVDVTWLAVE